MPDISVGRSPVAPNTEQTADIAQQGRVGNRRVSAQVGGNLAPMREHVDKSAVVTPNHDRCVGLAPDDPALVPISWFTEQLPVGAEPGGKHQDHFQLVFGSELLADDMRNVVNFAQKIDQDILRASELLEKSEYNPLNENEQREVNTLLNAGKYNLAQVQCWTSVTRDELSKSPVGLELITKLQERLADRHMDLADLMCLYDLDQVPPEAVSRADRIGHNLVAVDAAIKVVGGLAAIGLPEEAKQQMVEALDSHRAILGKVNDVAIGNAIDSDSSHVLSNTMWSTPFTLTKGKQSDGELFLNTLRKHWKAKAAGATGAWLPSLARYKVTEEQMLQEFVSHQLKQAGVAKKDMPDLKFQFKEATIQALNERTWEPIEKELRYSVAGESYKVRSTITPAKLMAAGRFATDIPANGVCCGDRMQYTHVPNLARTELSNESGTTLFSALRHGVLDAYDITASSLCKLPDQALTAMVKNLLTPRNTENDGAPPPVREDGVGRAGADAPVQKSDNAYIAYKGEFGNMCPEDCAVFVANHFNLACKFETYNNTDQIDIFLPLSKHAPETENNFSLLFTGGKNEESSLNYLLGMDKNSIYFMRTGTNDGGGHNQMLYSKDGEWFAHDSEEKNPSQLTASGSLTNAGRVRMVNKKATWGLGNGETSISAVTVTEKGAKALISFVKDCRNGNEDSAIENLYKDESPVQPGSSADIAHDSQMQQQMQQIASESPYEDIDFEGGASQIDGAGKVATAGDANASPAVALTYGDADYATIQKQRTPIPEIPAQYSDEAWESTFTPDTALDAAEDGVGRAVAGSGADATVQKSDNNKISYLGEFQDTCPEECAVFVANYFNLECQFETYNNTDQMDIFIPLSMNAPERSGSQQFTDGKSEPPCLNYLLDMDKGSVYLMRTGRNGAAGHNQILYSKDNEWFVYNSATNQSQLTASGALTGTGRDLMVKEHAAWGSGNGETSITTVKVTEKGAKALIGFVKDCRNGDEGSAIANLFAGEPPVQPRSSADIGREAQMQQQMQQIASESPYMDMEDLASPRSVSDIDRRPPAALPGVALSSNQEQRVSQIVNAIRTNPTQASEYASAMRTVASENMAKELAVAALVSDPDKLQAALGGKVVDLNLSSISLLTPDRLRSNPKSNERAMLRRQTEALNNLSGATNLQVRDASGELRTVSVNCKVRTFNFGVNAGAVGRAKHIPSHTLGWDKLMGWGYAMERNNPQLRTLLGDSKSATLGGDVQNKLTELEGKHKQQQHLLDVRKETAANQGFEAETRGLEQETAVTSRRITTLREAAQATKQIWREGSYNKGGQDPYKMVSRLGMVINEMDETLAFNCKSGKDRTGQLDAELKYLTAQSTVTGHLPNLGAPVTPQLRQMRSDFTLNAGNLEMQRMNTGLPGFKLDIKGVPGLANFIAGAEMESIYRGGSKYIKS